MTALIAGLLSPFLIGGTLAAVRTPEARVWPAMVAGAGRAPGALLVIWIVTRFLGLGLALAAGMVLSTIVNRIGGELWEPGLFIGFVAGATAGVIVWWLLVAVGDTAMIMRTEPEPAGAFRAIARAFGFVFHHPLRVAWIWLGRGVLPAGLMQLVYVRASDALLTAPVALVGLQQLVMIGRAWCRVSVLGAERELVVALRPAVRLGRRDEDEVRPGQDGERQIEHRQESQGPVQLEAVEEHRTSDGQQLGDGERWTDAGVTERERDERVALGEPEGGNPEVSKDPVERL
jgi:hypothetical protein